MEDGRGNHVRTTGERWTVRGHACQAKRPLTVAIIAVIDYDALMPQARTANSATLTIRGVDTRLKEALRVRAARHGHSMEAELRDILRRALAPDEASEPSLAEAIRRRMAPFGGVELEPHPPVPLGAPPAFGR